ncbi:MAG: 50S ribosomal protein L11 methyltransferase [Oscillospiraceae bacterium]|nr:50S ribosomal protein L11 methyltransferase [Oscillospiraceae bacterium]
MPEWLEVSLPCTPENIDSLATDLIWHGFECFQIEDSRDFFEFSPHWDMADNELIENYKDACRIIVYLPVGEDTGIDALRTLCPALTVQSRLQEDWEENWKKHYAPAKIGKRLLIQPAWIPLDNPENRAVFFNDPGIAFGTGTHQSTKLCLEMLEEIDVGAKRVLDIGCGSGILALCALKLGAKNALGIDIDPLAAEISSLNAVKNCLGDRYSGQALDFLSGGLPVPREGYGVIFSNIVADVIISMAPKIALYLAPGGLWIVSGIISPRLPEVILATAEAGMSVVQHRSMGGWEALCLSISP